MALSAKEARARRDRLRAQKNSGAKLSEAQQARMRAAKQALANRQKSSSSKPAPKPAPTRSTPTRSTSTRSTSTRSTPTRSTSTRGTSTRSTSTRSTVRDKSDRSNPREVKTSSRSTPSGNRVRVGDSSRRDPARVGNTIYEVRYDNKRDAKQAISRLQEKKQDGSLSDQQKARLRVARSYLESRQGGQGDGRQRGDIKSNKALLSTGQYLALNKKKDKVVRGQPGEGDYNRQWVSASKDSRQEINKLIKKGWTTDAPGGSGYDTRMVGIRHKGKYNGGVGAKYDVEPGYANLTLYRKKGWGKEELEESSGGRRTPRSNEGRTRVGESSPYSSSSGRPAEPSTFGSSSGSSSGSGGGGGEELPAFGDPPTYENEFGESGYNGGVGYRQGPQDDSVDPIGAAGSDGFIRTHWDTSPERAIDYADRLGEYNAANLDYLGGVGEQSGYQMGKYLDSFASSIPKAPDTQDGYGKVLDFLERANKRLY